MAEHWNGGNGGKGSKPRPYAIAKDEFDQKFDTIFGEKKKYCDKCGKKFSWCQCDVKNETDDKLTRYNEETQQVLGVKTYSTEI
jgi:hypothetical protein